MEITVAILLLAAAGIGFLVQHAQRKQTQEAERAKRSLLAEKYKGSPVRDDILNRTIRVGMTVDELIDAWGPPVAVDVRVLKTKAVHTYKYAQTGARSFRQRVRVENGIVVGWTNT